MRGGAHWPPIGLLSTMDISEWPVTQFLSLSHAFWPVRTSTVPSVWCSGRLVFLLFTRLARARSPRPRGQFENPTTRCKVRALYFMKNTNYHKNIYFFMGGKCISSDGFFYFRHTASVHPPYVFFHHAVFGRPVLHD